MAKIALVAMSERAGTAQSGIVARGEGWSVQRIVCSAGPHDRPFEEQHSSYSVSLVLGGSFQYRSSLGRVLMIPGSALLGNAGTCFECSHQHGVGDHCLSLQYSAEYVRSRLAGISDSLSMFAAARIPPTRALTPTFARAIAALADVERSDWESFALSVAVSTVASSGAERKTHAKEHTAAAEARVTRVVRMIEAHPELDFRVEELAREAKLSVFHFLRMFLQLTALTPHQYVRRIRLRRAAAQLVSTSKKVIEVASDCGFGDLSNFNHAFRAEFGESPREFRLRLK